MDIYASKLSPAVDIITGVFLFVVVVLSIVGNLMVLIVARKRSSSMRSPELLSVNLALTDLGAAVTMYPLAIASAWNHHWLGGDATCVYYGLVGFFFGVASMMTLTVMAVVRFFVSLSARTPNEKISRRSVKILCLATWLYGLLWALFPVLGLGKYGPEPFGLSCSLDWRQLKEEGVAFGISTFSLILVIPSIIIIFCYFGIALKLHFTYNSIKACNQIPNIAKMNSRLLKIAVLISAGFIVCWAPYGVMCLWSIYQDSSSVPPEVSLLPCMFAKSSTVYNPFIYYTFSKSFKSEVKKLGWLCGGSNACHASNITENGIYMICDETKHNVDRTNNVQPAFEGTKMIDTATTLG